MCLLHNRDVAKPQTLKIESIPCKLDPQLVFRPAILPAFAMGERRCIFYSVEGRKSANVTRRIAAIPSAFLFIMMNNFPLLCYRIAMLSW